MSRYSPSPSRHRRSRSPAHNSQIYSERERYRRSPEKRRRRRSSPDYSRYTSPERRVERRGPDWLEGDISEEDIREQAGGDYIEFRRLKRLKLNERGVKPFWRNSPSLSPRRKKRNAAADGQNGPSEVAARLEDNESAVDLAREGDFDQKGNIGAVRTLQLEIEAAGPEIAELHMKAAELFQFWLAAEKAAAAEAEARRKQQEADNVIIGPVLETAEKAAVDYGTHMRPGEGTAMAAYVQSGKRIPRRGEVGMSADQISTFEDLGYVMSGSRHNRMNAIRIRKENQVYTAEEKAALAMFNMEENKRKEQKILLDMERLVQQTLGENQEEQEDEDVDIDTKEAVAS